MESIEAVKVHNHPATGGRDDAAVGGRLFQCCRIADDRRMDTYE